MMDLFRARRSSLAIQGTTLVLLALASASTVQAQTDLKWVFKPGETLRYEFSQNTTSKFVVQGQEISNINDLKIVMTWKVDSVAPDGTASIAQTIDHVRAEIQVGPGKIIYDSKEEKVEGQGAESLSELYGNVIGEPYSLKISAKGKILEATVPQKVSDALKGSPFQVMADGGSVLSPEGVKNMLAQVIPALPEKPVNPNDTWESQLDLPAGQLQMSLATKYNLAGAEGGKATIHSTIDSKIQPRQGAPLKLEVKSQSGKGDFHFSTADGRLNDSTVNQKFELVLNPADRKIEQSIDLTARMKYLAEPAK